MGRPWFDTPRVRLVVLVAAAVGFAMGVETLVLHLSLDPLADVRAYYDAGARLNAGVPLYQQTQGVGVNAPGFYRYPPLLAIAFRPLAALPYTLAAGIWEGVVLLAFAL